MPLFFDNVQTLHPRAEEVQLWKFADETAYVWIKEFLQTGNLFCCKSVQSGKGHSKMVCYLSEESNTASLKMIFWTKFCIWMT